MGSDQDKRKAFEYYLELAKKGYYQDQYNVGKCYHFGIGIEENIDVAVNWYEKASCNRSINAKNALNNPLSSDQIS
jgi:TPR repeat protein